MSTTTSMACTAMHAASNETPTTPRPEPCKATLAGTSQELLAHLHHMPSKSPGVQTLSWVNPKIDSHPRWTLDRQLAHDCHDGGQAHLLRRHEGPPMRTAL
jgi:hypothetical protein